MLGHQGGNPYHICTNGKTLHSLSSIAQTIVMLHGADSSLWTLDMGVLAQMLCTPAWAQNDQIHDGKSIAAIK